MYLLCISGLDDTENLEIYETYMHSDQIAYTGKKPQVRKSFKFDSGWHDITTFPRSEIISKLDVTLGKR
jgi:hypothetical protein